MTDGEPYDLEDRASPTPAAGEVVVEVEVGEYVAPGGIAAVLWKVRGDDDWLLVADHPRAVVVRLEARAGTVWANAVELRVAPGTILRRIEARPDRSQRRDPIEYLLSGTPERTRVTTHRDYRATDRGELVPVPLPRPREPR